MYYMSKLIIIGATSSICRNKVFHNLNAIDIFDKIYCYGWEDWTTNDFIFYLSNEVQGDVSKLISKVEFIHGNYNDYDHTLLNILNKNTIEDTIIYVSTPPCCYYDVMKFNKDNTLKTNHLKVIFEKPFANNYSDYKLLKPLIMDNIYIVDHFLYKTDLVDVIKHSTNCELMDFKISFLYSEDVEHRLGYFNKTGMFKDMFQSHFLAVLYGIIGNKVDELLDATIVQNIRKQYSHYGGDNHVDTYFNVELQTDNCKYVFESGKYLPDKRCVSINNIEYVIHSYENEYSLFFTNLLANKHKNLTHHQDKFWKIYEYIQNKKIKTNLIDEKY